MTAVAPTPQRVTKLPAIDPAGDEFKNGLWDAAGQFLDPEELHWLDDRHPALNAWTSMRNGVLEEVGPEIARILNEAMERRLPWTWEPER